MFGMCLAPLLESLDSGGLKSFWAGGSIDSSYVLDLNLQVVRMEHEAWFSPCLGPWVRIT